MADVVDRSGEVSTELPSVVMALYSWMLIVLNTRGLPVPIKLRGARLVIMYVIAVFFSFFSALLLCDVIRTNLFGD